MEALAGVPAARWSTTGENGVTVRLTPTSSLWWKGPITMVWCMWSTKAARLTILLWRSQPLVPLLRLKITGQEAELPPNELQFQANTHLLATMLLQAVP